MNHVEAFCKLYIPVMQGTGTERMVPNALSPRPLQDVGMMWNAMKKADAQASLPQTGVGAVMGHLFKTPFLKCTVRFGNC